MPQYTNPEGYRLSYAVAGQGPPVILLHGIVQSGAEWRRAGWVDGLSDLYQVVTIDLLGHGESDRPHDPAAYRVERRARDVLGLAHTLGMNRFDLLGFSLGGRVGFEIAANHPGVLERLVVLGQHAGAPRHHRVGLDKQVKAFRSGRLPAMERGLGLPGGSVGATVNDPEAMALSIEALLEWEGAEHHLPRIGTPAMICAGEDDPAFDAARRTAEAMPRAEFFSCGRVNHQGSFYEPERSLHVIRRFLSDPDPELAKRDGSGSEQAHRGC